MITSPANDATNESGERGEVNNKQTTKENMPKSTSSSTLQSRASKSKRPKDTSFHQQKMAAVQPIMSPTTIIPTLLLIGLVFVPLGIIQLVASSRTQEYVFDYTSCPEGREYQQVEQNGQVFEMKKENGVCSIRFTTEKALGRPVYMYYRLTNFYQNNRLYSRSLSYAQLKGDAVPIEDLAKDCTPLLGPEGEKDNDGKPVVYYPCGLVPNSIFIDSISGMRDAQGNYYSFPAKNISWRADNVIVQPTKYRLDQVRAPPYWRNRADVDPATGKYRTLPDLGLDERFLNWIRLSGLPTFRKLYGKCTHKIPPGTYTISIQDRYDVVKFQGTKSVIISEATFLGGKSSFMGIAYVVVGGLLLVLGLLFLVKQCMSPRIMGDVRYLPWFRNLEIIN